MLKKLLSEFSFKHLSRDLPASLAVFLVAVPLCLGIAHASNAPLLSGLITGIVGGIVVGALSKSPLSVSGPAAGLTAIVAAAAATLQDFGALLVAVFLAGVIQIGLGLAKAGGISSYIPSSVIRGMLSAIGIILILKQLPHLMGYDPPEADGMVKFMVEELTPTNAEALSHGHEGIGKTFLMIWEAVQAIPLNMHIFAIGLLSMLLIVFWDNTLGKRLKVVPSSLIAVLVGTVLAIMYGVLSDSLSLTANHLVQLPPINSVDDFVSQTVFPSWSALTDPNVYVIAFTLAFVASIETLLCIEATDKMDPERRWTPKNRELLAQGTGNALCGLIGGIPMTSVIVRSSVNLQAGGMTKLSTIMHGLWMLMAIVLAAGLINLIPLATLAAVLVVTGFKLANPKQFKVAYKQGVDQFVPYLSTIVAVVMTDLLIGVLLGLAVSVVFILYNYYRSNVVQLIDEGKTHTKRLIFAENLTFLNKGRVKEVLESIPDGSQVVLDTSQCQYIDHDIVEAMQEFAASADERKLKIVSDAPSRNGRSKMRTQRLNTMLEEAQAGAH